MNIYEKLLAITKEAEQIPKNGWNEHGKYKYVKAVDALGETKKLLIKYKVHLSIGEKEYKRYRDGKSFHSEINCVAYFINIEDPKDIHETPYFSTSADTYDKDIFKAKTNGLKYLFTQEFKLVTDDFIDTEQGGKHEKEDPSITEKQLDIINNLTMETETDTNKFIEYVFKTFNTKELTNLSYVAGEALIANLNFKLDKQNAENN